MTHEASDSIHTKVSYSRIWIIFDIVFKTTAKEEECFSRNGTRNPTAITNAFDIKYHYPSLRSGLRMAFVSRSLLEQDNVGLF